MSELRSISIRMSNQNVELYFEDLKKIKNIIGLQQGHLFNLSDDDFCAAWQRTLQHQWNTKVERGIFAFDKSINSLDIGSGVGMIDILLYKYLNDPNSHFYLVDKNELSKKDIHWGDDHGFYNNWDIFFDIAKNSDVNTSQFTMLNPTDPWPEKLDLIMSNSSYMFHYPKETYWDKIKTHAINRCRLAFDISYLPDRDYAEEISVEIGSFPRIYRRGKRADYRYDSGFTIRDGYWGHTCIWN
jgi:hypothetical protein